MAAAGNDTCDLDIQLGQRRRSSRYSVPTSATVMELKRRIMSDTGLDGWRLNLFVLPQGTKMENGETTLAAYGIRAGESRSLFVDIAKISVMAAFVGYQNMAYPLRCYEWDSVMDLKLLIVGELHKVGVHDVGAEDMELSLNGHGPVFLADVRAPLSRYGVQNQSWVYVKTNKEIVLIRRGPTSAL